MYDMCNFGHLVKKNCLINLSSRSHQPPIIIISNRESFLLCAIQVLGSASLNVTNVILQCLKARRPVVIDSFPTPCLNGLSIYFKIPLLQTGNRCLQQLLTLFNISTTLYLPNISEIKEKKTHPAYSASSPSETWGSKSANATASVERGFRT